MNCAVVSCLTSQSTMCKQDILPCFQQKHYPTTETLKLCQDKLWISPVFKEEYVSQFHFSLI